MRNELNRTVVVFSKLIEELGADLSGCRIAVWGLSFKAETDDVREASSLLIIPKLMDCGADVIAHDPKAIESARSELPPEVEYAADEYTACEGADALLILTEWLQYRRPDFGRIKTLLKRPLVVDGRNLFTPEKMKNLGFKYLSIGRPDVI